MDPSTLAAGLLTADKTARNLEKVVVGSASAGGVKRFGIGNPAEERNCSRFFAYVCVEGVLSTQKRVLEVKKREPTLNDVRDQYIAELPPQDVRDTEHAVSLRQELILDQDGYELSPGSLVSDFSHRCNVSLRFVDSARATGFAAGAAETVEGAGKKLRNLFKTKED
eukprot:TRINITY_DN21130_c0_g1_i1.p1 TRINITY_DN21130_c0_g1~~TRINITY_DN21130_c0_g1_i1.p1  ORF type:complete len:167 (+),score=22.11 TRINITY_DN21130_c0_g1_i1:72-572(+)